MTTNSKRSSAKALLDIGAIGFSPDAPITFKSGIRSPVYVDNRRLIYHPATWHVIIEGFQSLIETRQLPFDTIAGVAVGGVPHSSVLAYIMSRPSVFIRKQTKGHGMGNRVEGGAVAGRRVLLVEDLITTGGSSLSAVDALRAAGAIVTDALAIISYGFDEARAAFAAANVALHTLTDFETLLQLADGDQLLNRQQVTLIRRWFADPYAWSTQD
ncbi:MAG: orotate phosphoribosyltransferase [Chloroflexi bacterium]|nr:orotate phosphoribosyltransferase [Chloroflexota bacterium]